MAIFGSTGSEIISPNREIIEINIINFEKDLTNFLHRVNIKHKLRKGGESYGRENVRRNIYEKGRKYFRCFV